MEKCRVSVLSVREEAFLADAIEFARHHFESKRLPYGLADEATSRLASRLLMTIRREVDRYPTGSSYVRAVRRSVLVDAIRSNDAQRGSGVRHRREVASFEDSHETTAMEPDPMNEIESRELLSAMLAAMTSDEQRDFCRTRVVGFNFSDVAALNCEAHTTVMRRVHRADEKARLVVGRLTTNGVHDRRDRGATCLG